MCAVKMRPDEVDVDSELVRRLVAARFPRWASLPVERLVSSGTENAMFRLGTDKVVRLPRHPGAVESVAYESHWLERLGPRLSVASPVPLAQGGPGEGFPWPWSVYRWLDGRNPVAGALERPESLASDLGTFVAGLRRVDARGGPPGHRGVPLAERDAPTRSALGRLEGRIDTAAVTALWEEALRAPGRTAPPRGPTPICRPGTCWSGTAGSPR